MHPTTIAKIEAGDRSVRINEAIGIADLFETSLDVLLDLRRRPQPDDVSYALGILRTTTVQATHQLEAVTAAFCEQLRHLDDIPADVDQDDDLRTIRGEAESIAHRMQNLHRQLAEIASHCGELFERELTGQHGRRA